MKTYQATVPKESETTQFGLILSQKNGSKQVLIKNITPNSLFRSTDLCPGLHVVKINHQTFETVQDAILLLKQAPVGEVSVVAKGKVATVEKEIDTKVGVSIQRHTKSGTPPELTIQNVSSDGILAHSGLKKGYKISAINGQPCPATAREAIAVISQTVGNLTIVAVESEILPPPTRNLGSFLEDHQESAPETSSSLVAVQNGGTPRKKGVTLDSFLEDHRPESMGSEFDSLRTAVNGTNPNKIHNEVPESSTRPIIEDSEYGEEEMSTKLHSEVPESSTKPIVEDSEYGTEEMSTKEYAIEKSKPQPDLPDERTIIVSKSYPFQKVGLVLRNANNRRVMVDQITPGGLADTSRTRLYVGQTILSVNGERCRSAKRATQQITDAPRTVTIVVTNTAITAVKEARNTKIGLTMKSSSKPRGVFVESVNPNGIFRGSNLRKGQHVVGINGKECLSSGREAMQFLKSSTGTVTIVVGDRGLQPKPQREEIKQRHQQQEVPRRAVTPQQEQPDGNTRSVIPNKKPGEWIGLSFAKSSNDSIVVRKIAETSPLKDTRLKVGKRIVSVNGEDCPKTITGLISLLYNSSGDVAIVSSDGQAQSPRKEVSKLPGHVWAHVHKEEKDQPVGLKVIRSRQDRIVVSTIKEDGLLAKSRLRVGQFLVSINGAPCPSTKAETTKLIKETVGDVTIVASSSIGTGKKQKKSTPVGITVTEQNGDIVISKVAKNCILRGTRQGSLREGQKVVAINGRPCPATMRAATAVIKETVGRLTIEAVDRFGTKSNGAASEGHKASEPRANGRVVKEDWLEFKSIIATVTSKKSGDMLGLSLDGTKNYVYVSHIAADSPFVGTNLCVGHRISNINDEPCPLPVEDAIELYSQHVGTMTIVALERIVSAGQVSASIVKPSKTTQCGIEACVSDQRRFAISNIVENGPFASSPLRVGQLLKSINGKSCSDEESMNTLLGAATGKVTVVSSPIVGTGYKDNIDQKAGIVLRKTGEQGEILIHEIKKNGLFHNSDLREGQAVVSIAGVRCPDDLREAIGLIQDCVGELKIVAVDTMPKLQDKEQAVQLTKETAEPIVGEAVVSVFKQSAQTRIGMKLRKGIQKGKVVISTINEEGLLDGKGLE
eukprot:scaffold26140_cov147-Cylindrotheca_fusiformis.AAC.1